MKKKNRTTPIRFSISPAPARPPRFQRALPAPLALEQRLVFDGDVAKGAEAALDAGTLLAALTSAKENGHDDSAAKFASEAALPTEPAAPTPTEVVFVDTAITNWQTLINNLRPDIEVVLIDPSRDGLAQIQAALSGRTGLTAIHIVSHGAEGTLRLGATDYNISNLGDHAAALSAIGAALTDDGDLLLWGCDIARGWQGAALLGRLADHTGADVAASTNTTGHQDAGGDWHLESATGSIESALFLTEAGVSAFTDRLPTISLSGSSGWTAVMFGAIQDPQGDSQAGAADTDIIGDASHGSLYVAYDDNGTADPSDDTLAFRLRIDNPTSSSPAHFNGVAIVGIDANLDGRVDIFLSVDGRNNTQAVRLLDPGTGANISPNTTTTSPLPTGWLPNNGVYPFTSSNYAVVAVSAQTDPHWNGNANLGSGGNDIFVSWRIPIADIATVLAKPSPTDRNGVYGPRGSTGIAGFNKDTVLRYVSFTQTQPGPINGDLNGVGGGYDKNATFESLGTFTAPMSASEPISAGPLITISEPISGGMLNDAEDDSVSISGTSKYLPNRTLTLTVSDGTNSVQGTTTTANDGTWTVTGLNLSTLNDGTLTVTATALDDSSNTITDLASVAHDKTPPAVTIDQLATSTSGRPTITGTSDLPDGSILTVTIDHDNNTLTASLVYQVVVSGGVWSLNTNTVSPTSGTMPANGLTSYAKITASATDAAGNTATATSLNRPTVTALTTNQGSPTITGTWTNISGDVLTVTAGGATYTLTPSGNTWTLNLATATPASGTFTPFSAGNSYEVVATVTRGANNVSDTSTGEVTVTNTPVVSVGINGGANVATTDTTPTITGTSENAGGFVIVRLDPGNDGNLSDAVSYSVNTDGSGNWSLNTESATPISGTTPSSGYLGTVGVYVTDSTGNTSASQVLTISTPAVAISSIISAASANTLGTVSNSGGGQLYLNQTEDDSVTISGTATTGFTVDLTISDAFGNSITSNGHTVTGGNWSATGLNLSSLENSTLTITARLNGTNITATDTSVTHDKVAPTIINTTQDPIRASSGSVIRGVTDLPVGTTITVTIFTASNYSGSPSRPSPPPSSPTAHGASPLRPISPTTPPTTSAWPPRPTPPTPPATSSRTSTSPAPRRTPSAIPPAPSTSSPSAATTPSGSATSPVGRWSSPARLTSSRPPSP